MDDLGIMPPMAPGAQVQEKKKGLFSGLLSKISAKTTAKENPETTRITSENFDIEDIRKKMGLETIEDEETLNNIDAPANIEQGAQFPELPIMQTKEESKIEELEEVEALPQEIHDREHFDEPEAVKEGELPELALETPKQKPPKTIDEITDFTKEEQKEEVETQQSDFTQEANHPSAQKTTKSSEHDWTADTHKEETKNVVKAKKGSFDTEQPFNQEKKATKEPAPANSGLDEELDALHEELNASEQQANTSTYDTTTEVALPPPIHKAVKDTLGALEKKHNTIDKELKKTIKRITVDVPDWAVQQKEVHPDKFFTLKNGQKIRSFKELLGALSFIDEETFAHHANDSRNDFSEWVKHVLAEEQLAEKIRNKVARKDLLKILRAHETKMIKEFEQESKKFKKLESAQKQKHKKVEALQKKIAALTTQVQEQSEQLASLRGDAGKKVKTQITKHLDEEFSKEAEKLDERSEEIEKLRIQLENLQEKLDKREKEHHCTTQEIIEEQKELKKAQETFAKDKENAHLLLAQAKEILQMRAEAQNDLAAITKLLVQNKKATADLHKQEKSTHAIVAKMKSDEKKMAKELAKYTLLKKDVDSREKTIAGKEKTIDKKLKTADKWYAQVKKEKAEFAIVHTKGLAELKKKEKEVTAILKDLDKKTQVYKELVDKHEKELKRNEEVLEETQNVRDEINRKQEALSSASMKEYLRTTNPGRVVDKMTGTGVPPVEEITNLHLYKMIDKCKDALEKNNVEQARKVYKELRDEFSTTKLSSHEKSVLYNSIRELYDDIHLAMLNQ